VRSWRFEAAQVIALLAIAACSIKVRAQETNAISTIDLPTALRLAGARNLEVQIAQEKLNEARANRSSATERFFPWLSPGVSFHRRDGVAQAVPAGTISDAHFESYSPGMSLAAQMDLGDAIYKNLAAKQLVKASSEALETQRQDTQVSAAKAYFDLAKARGLLEVAREAVKTSQDYEGQLHEAVAAGIAFKGDELRVQTQTKQFQIAVRQAVEQQRVAAVELARILRLDPRTELVPQDAGQARITLFDPDSKLDPLINQALRSRPELKESEALVLAARQDKSGAVYGPAIPSLNAQAFGGGLGGGPDSGASHFGAEGDYLVGMSWRVGPGGLFDSGRIHATKARLAVSELSEAKLKDDIAAQVVASVTRVQSLSDQINLAEGKLASATETLRVTHERKQFGVGIVLEDLQAQQDLDRARSDYVSTLQEYNKAQYNLSRAIGSLPEQAVVPDR
jgi:outer membrane protein TolC